MAISRWPHRVRSGMDPDATLDFAIDWTDWLATGESIVSSDWEVDGATDVDASESSGVCTVWLTDPTGTSITATNTITTDSAPVARVDQRSLVITVADK
jgi:hypothetical protein